MFFFSSSSSSSTHPPFSSSSTHHPPSMNMNRPSYAVGRGKQAGSDAIAEAAAALASTALLFKQHGDKAYADKLVATVRLPPSHPPTYLPRLNLSLHPINQSPPLSSTHPLKRKQAVSLYTLATENQGSFSISEPFYKVMKQILPQPPPPQPYKTSSTSFHPPTHLFSPPTTTTNSRGPPHGCTRPRATRLTLPTPKACMVGAALILGRTPGIARPLVSNSVSSGYVLSPTHPINQPITTDSSSF